MVEVSARVICRHCRQGLIGQLAPKPHRGADNVDNKPPESLNKLKSDLRLSTLSLTHAGIKSHLTPFFLLTYFRFSMFRARMRQCRQTSLGLPNLTEAQLQNLAANRVHAGANAVANSPDFTGLLEQDMRQSSAAAAKESQAHG